MLVKSSITETVSVSRDLWIKDLLFLLYINGLLWLADIHLFCAIEWGLFVMSFVSKSTVCWQS